MKNNNNNENRQLLSYGLTQGNQVNFILDPLTFVAREHKIVCS